MNKNKSAGLGSNHKAYRVSAVFAFPLLRYAIILASVMERGDEGDSVSLRGGRVCKFHCVVVSRKPLLCQLEPTSVDGRSLASTRRCTTIVKDKLEVLTALEIIN